MHHILVGVDGSQWSQVAAHYALDFARAENAEVRALAVMPPEVLQALGEPPETLAYSERVPEGEQLARRTINDWFAATEQLCAEAGVCFMRNIDAGEPAHRLIWAALPSRLCVLGAHGANAPEESRGSLGKVTTALLRSAVKPLLITRETYRPVRRVIVGWDGHPDAAHAAEVAFRAARAYDWEVYVVSGTEAASPLAASCGYLAETMAKEGVSAQAFVEPGNAPEIIFHALEHFDADLVAIGGRQKSATAHLLRGNAWYDLVEQLPVPVLLWR